jgi:TrmH family RNA methyltransferase
VVQTLQEAVADCSIVAGATARDREHYQQVCTAREAARQATALQSQSQSVAFIFGSERFGLSNEDLERCNWLLRIPTHPVYPSLNLGQAVQIVCYELLMAAQADAVPAPQEREAPLATSSELEHLYVHLEQVMREADFRDRTPSGGNLMGRLRRLFNRAELDRNETNILRGILRAVQKKWK